ncbi:hypothetical protein LCGC14_2322370, partial [marine sediment metagenome]
MREEGDARIVPNFIVAYGTRPEKLKLEPVISALRKRGASV